MDWYQVVVRDLDREYQLRLSEECLYSTIASLASDPECIADLGVLAQRYMGVHWKPDWIERYREKDVAHMKRCRFAIDLGARSIFYDRQAVLPPTSGSIRVQTRDENRSYQVEFNLSLEWQTEAFRSDWRAVGDARRNERDAWQKSFRKVLYRDVIPFALREVWLQMGGELPDEIATRVQSRPDWEIEFELRQATLSDPRLLTQAKWMLMPNSDLAGKTPHQVIASGVPHLEFDLATREEQWQLTLTPPVGIPFGSRSFQRASAGPNEVIIYDMLCFSLIDQIWRAVEKVREARSLTVDAWNERSSSIEEKVKSYRDKWLKQPNQKWLEGLSPQEVCDLERQRMPMRNELPTEEEACECPLCQMLHDDGAVSFWRMEERMIASDYPFSRYLTAREWEEEMGWQLTADQDVLQTELGTFEEDWMAASEQIRVDFDVTDEARAGGRGTQQERAGKQVSSDQLRRHDNAGEDLEEDPSGFRIVTHQLPKGMNESVYMSLFELGSQLAQLQSEIKLLQSGTRWTTKLNACFRSLHLAIKSNENLQRLREACENFEATINEFSDELPSRVSTVDGLTEAFNALQELLFDLAKEKSHHTSPSAGQRVTRGI